MLKSVFGRPSHPTHKYQLVEMVSSSEKKVIDEANSDDDVLAQLGYTQGEHAKDRFYGCADDIQSSSAASDSLGWSASLSASSLLGLLFQVFSS
jgi:hypothetical protein